jgi:uncharacterized membrane protein YgcG
MDWSLGIVIAVAVGVMLVFRKALKATQANLKKAQEETAGRMEALFRASFPELQPHFHPARVLEYVRARRARVPSGSPTTWRKPPGFPAADRAEIVLEGMKDNVRLVDAAGAPVAKFVYEEHPEGGVIRLGKGKFTVNLKGPEPRVRYWHPEREFKWTPTLWKMKSGVSDHELESSSSSSSTSSGDDSARSSSSTSTTAAAAAAGAGIVAAGGTFDGGGASAAWDDGGGSSSSSPDSGSSVDFSSVESGSSSSSSTTY